MLVRLLLIIAVLVSAAAWSQETPPEGEPVSAEEIEHVISTLENADSREKLLNDLAVLLEARRVAAEKVDPGRPDLLEWAREKALALWKSVLAVEAEALAISLSLSVAVVIGALVVRALLLRLMEKLYWRLWSGDSEEEEADARAAQAVKSAQGEAEAEASGKALPAMVPRMINLLVIISALALLAGSWGADLGAMFASDAGARLVNMLFSIGVILVVTTIVWHTCDQVVNRVLRLYSQTMEEERRERRMSTLVPLISSVLRVTVGTIATLMVLSQLGINIAPLLAGAGILGLAVGFGAQTLVRDLITGIIILMEDSASAGDVIETGDHIGVVEEMRIRVMQLRDIHGIVHIIPYGEVTWIKNHTMDFSYYLFDFGVAYRENTDEVIDVLTKLGREFQQEEPFRQYILAPLEVLGVQAFADSAVIIRARYKTVPGQQWAVGRAFNARVKKRFDELDIEIPFPHTTLYFGTPKEGSAPPLPLDSATRQAIVGTGDRPG